MCCFSTGKIILIHNQNCDSSKVYPVNLVISYRFCIKVDLYSPCGLGKAYTKDYCDEREMCRSAECVSYGAEAKCRTVGCDNSCRVEWYHNGHVITPSCVG